MGQKRTFARGLVDHLAAVVAGSAGMQNAACCDPILSKCAADWMASLVVVLKMLHHFTGRLFDKRSPIMLRRVVTLSRYVVFVAVVAAPAASVALILYEAAVVADVIFNAVKQGGFQLQSGKALAVGLI